MLRLRASTRADRSLRPSSPDRPPPRRGSLPNVMIRSGSGLGARRGSARRRGRPVRNNHGKVALRDLGSSRRKEPFRVQLLFRSNSARLEVLVVAMRSEEHKARRFPDGQRTLALMKEHHGSEGLAVIVEGEEETDPLTATLITLPPRAES